MEKNIIESLKLFNFKNSIMIITYATLHDFNAIKEVRKSKANLTICADQIG